jgi:DNA invertase Pin-like site-specific DNA recombinase
VRSEGRSSGRSGLEGQRQALAAACRRRGWRPLEEARPAATDVHHPGGAEARALVASKRVGRSRALPELASLIAAAQRQGWALVALEDTPGPAGEQTANVRATLAPLERALISTRTRAALAAKRAQGVRLGRPPSPATRSSGSDASETRARA